MIFKRGKIFVGGVRQRVRYIYESLIAPVVPDPVAPSNEFLLLETGHFLLLETGDKIILE